MLSPAPPLPEVERAPSTWWQRTLLAGIVAAGALLRFSYIARKSFWLDEGVSVEIARLDWSNFLHILWRREGNMALYYALLRGWLLVGGSEAMVRALSAVFSVATLPVVFFLGKRLAGPRAGLAAAALLAFHAWHIRYAQEARSYALYVFLVSLASLLFLKALRNPSRSAWTRYVAAAALAVYSHFFALLAVLAHTAWSRIRPLAPDARAEYRRALYILGLLLLPLLVFIAVRGMGPIAWIPRPSGRDLHMFFLFLTGNGSNWLLALYVIAAGAALWMPRPASRPSVPALLFLLLWLGLPVVVTLAFSFLRPAFLPRYLLMCVVPLVLLAAMGLARIPPRWLAAALLALMLAFSLRAVLAYYRADFDLGREDWRTCTRVLLDHAQPGDGVLFHSAQARMPFEYYAGLQPGRRALRIIFPAQNSGESAVLTSRDFLSNTKNLRLASLPAQYRRIWVVLAHNRLPTGQADTTTREIEDFLQQHYGQPVRSQFPGIDLLLYGSSAPAR